MPSSNGDYAVAFCLCLLAGLCTTLGACMVFVLDKAKSHLLSAAVGLAAGVMIFVSLNQVLVASEHDLNAGGLTPVVSQLIAYICFFCGIVICYILDLVTDRFVGLYASEPSKGVDKSGEPSHATQFNMQEDIDIPSGLPPQMLGSQITSHVPCSAGYTAGVVQTDIPLQVFGSHITSQIPRDSDNAAGLLRTSILVGLALGLHNFPEGVATFVGYMSDARLGITLAISIAIHNIPEGIAVGAPVYYATGSKLKAIGWATISGLTEPAGALLGLGIHAAGGLNLVGIGITMAVVAGIMTGVALKELVPQSFEYDPSRKWSTGGAFAGMAVMATSIVMLTAWG